ncbi:ABC transporter permease [Microbacterium sp. 179-I 3D3 NHS]|uniref:ABC transporter permease n=1 Tax=Microbacterium sp. 179-I 3D3 NHS TaxID=3142382 RepID=UPI00399F013F
MTGAVRAIVGRNLRLFFRDRMAVFFSLLAAVILFTLYALFLGHLQVADLQESFPSATTAQIRAFVDSWMFAGVVSMTAITTGLGALGVLVEDTASGRFRDFLVAPIRSGQLALGYLLSAVIVALTMTFFVFAVSLFYLSAVDGVALSFGAVMRAAAIVVVTAAAFSAISAFVTSFVSSPGAYAALSTIVGTVLGFLTGAYIPIGSFPESVQTVVSALPFAQASMLMRQELASGALSDLISSAPEARGTMLTYYGMAAEVAGWPLTAGSVLAVLTVLFVVFAWLGALRIRGRISAANR